ncbi:MAG: AmmeMemoRadiSam system radical SAM enzyme [Thermodesulfobacteriota bacterium]
MRAALWYFQHDNDMVRCFLCAHTCDIPPRKRGKCNVRENRNGILWSLVYGQPVARHVDFIEKKPLYHVYPGSLSYSYGTAGCNFHCPFCLNADIAHPRKILGSTSVQDVPAQDIVSEALVQECSSIAATYTEPTVFMEYALDVARLGSERKLAQVFVTNGFMTPKSLRDLIPVLDAANVDLKSFRDDFYIQQCEARLKPVLQTLRSLKKAGVWLEVTTLVIPGLNDSWAELRELADFIAFSLGPETPWHLSAFHPSYKMKDRPRTPIDTLYKAREIGVAAGLHYVYLGNVVEAEYRHTYCHQCGRTLIDRSQMVGEPVGLHNGGCSECGHKLPGLGMQVSQELFGAHRS